MSLDREELSLDELREWAMDVAGPSGPPHEKAEVLALIRAAVDRDPDSPEGHYSLGFAIYHLYRNASCDLLVEAIEALRQAQVLDQTDPWSRLYEIYVLWECRNLHACLAAARLLDREPFLASPEWAWRATSADEIEFATMAELSIGGSRLSDLASRILLAVDQDRISMLPFVPRLFVRALDAAVEHSLLQRTEADRYRADALRADHD